MVSGLALRKAATGWEFVSEAALEKFIWENLQELFGIYPLRQQYICQGEISDILAVDNEGGLVVLELKNVEDRYLIQQLTRYYANLLEEMPFQEKVDYSRQVQLIALAPSYHRHNLIDTNYSVLKFNLLTFSITNEANNFKFVLQDLLRETVRKILLPYQVVEIPIVENIPEPPQVLIEWLGGCSLEEQNGFLKVRSKILGCSPKMKETVDKKTIQYGSGKTKLCAEICFQQASQKPILFLWLPTPNTLNRQVYKEDTNEIAYIKKPIIGRLRLWTNEQGISHLGHIAEGFGKMKLLSEWSRQSPSKLPKCLHEGQSHKSHTPVGIEVYMRSSKDSDRLDYWDFLSNLAVEKWFEKL
jgi:RecB family endonuclease NucS